MVNIFQRLIFFRSEYFPVQSLTVWSCFPHNWYLWWSLSKAYKKYECGLFWGYQLLIKSRVCLRLLLLFLHSRIIIIIILIIIIKLSLFIVIVVTNLGGYQQLNKPRVIMQILWSVAHHDTLKITLVYQYFSIDQNIYDIW